MTNESPHRDGAARAGGMPIPIAIVDYDPNWPRMFEHERRRILLALDDLVVGVEHIGSTAVPGLAAKPIIDILAGVRNADDLDAAVGQLTSIGYAYDPFPQFPDRRFLRDGSMGVGPHHMHLTAYGSDFWTEKILFRDWLRTHPQTARKYLALKSDLAARYGGDRERYERYTDGKNAFIGQVLTLARRHSRRTT